MTIRPAPASEAGFTLLELALSLALGVVLTSAFFMGFQGLMQAIRLVATESRGTQQVADVLETMAREIERADSVTRDDDYQITLTFPPGEGAPVRYRLTPVASNDGLIERQQGVGSWIPVGPRRVISNYHPFPGTLKSASGGDVTGYQGVPFFDLSPADVAHTPQLTIHAVVQLSQENPARYVRKVAVSRLVN